MKIQKTTTFSLECLSLEYALDAILIDNSPEAIKAAALYVWGCHRESWKDRIIDIYTLTDILREMGVEYKDIYDDEAYSNLLDELEDNQIDIFQDMNMIKKTKVECNTLKSVLAALQCPMDFQAVLPLLYDKYETVNIEFWQLMDFFTEMNVKLELKEDVYDDLVDYPIYIFS
jgi:hypothetical protein